MFFALQVECSINLAALLTNLNLDLPYQIFTTIVRDTCNGQHMPQLVCTPTEWHAFANGCVCMYVQYIRIYRLFNVAPFEILLKNEHCRGAVGQSLGFKFDIKPFCFLCIHQIMLILWQGAVVCHQVHLPTATVSLIRSSPEDFSPMSHVRDASKQSANQSANQSVSQIANLSIRQPHNQHNYPVLVFWSTWFQMPFAFICFLFCVFQQRFYDN